MNYEEAEAILDEEAKKAMPSWDLALFKKLKPQFHQVVLDSIIRANEMPRKKSKRPAKKFIPPLMVDVVAYFVNNGYTKEAAERAYKHYEEGEWTDSTGKPVVNWKQKMRTNWFNDKSKQKTTQTTTVYSGDFFKQEPKIKLNGSEDFGKA